MNTVAKKNEMKVPETEMIPKLSDEHGDRKRTISGYKTEQHEREIMKKEMMIGRRTGF